MATKSKSELLKAVKQASTKLSQAEAAAAAARVEYRARIVEALDQPGLTVREVGNAAGVSGQRVSQIARDVKAAA